MMDADVTTLAGVKGKHDSAPAVARHGHERGSVTLGGRRVPVERPRVRAVHGSGELPVPAYELLSSTEILGRMAMDRMLAGLSTRRYQIGLEPVGQQVSEVATATSRSAVSRKFVAETETALAELLSADLSTLDLVSMMIDGVHFAESCCVVVLGIDLQGTKHPLALVDDDGDVLVAAGVPPDVLIDPDHPDVVEPAWVVDEHTATFGQYRVVGGVPRDGRPSATRATVRC